MQGKHLYEYAVLRVVPRVEREEFVNMGVVICCKKENRLTCRINEDLSKIVALDTHADLEVIENYLRSFFRICLGEEAGSPIAKHDATSRFRWLTANRSSMIQTSRPHVGFTDDLEKELERLYEVLVEA
ncbi:MAG: DUF3037 domain-containing protein [Lunatimonas sp.]|uniref:DUF3037 domain-containing protein n=1 Tax=Lunatimonas sp. TaxID=2060141 RepID=UPI00263B03AE|nr:DUF3037 domain-containing protein [Lunatimonas sp.]MCC5939171.1 DUF3037 domain-containing protein [Lunatimonas sp.]